MGYHGYFFSLRLLWQAVVLAKIINFKRTEDNVSLLKGWISMSHAPNSADLNAEDYNIWLEMWQRVYQTKFHNAKELNQRMLDIRHGLKQSAIDDAFGHQLCVMNDA